jgi:2-iminobutanoate/2-iminopropanoate deaminase
LPTRPPPPTARHARWPRTSHPPAARATGCSSAARWRIAGDTVGEQTRRCLARIDGILQAEGLALADVVKTTVWLGQVADFPEFNESYAAVFAATQAPAPARSTVRADLMMPGALVEIEAIARNRS